MANDPKMSPLQNHDRQTMEWIDISVPVRTGMPHWPGDIDVAVTRVSSIANGAACNVSELHMSAHTGTHMDAPLHFIDSASAIDQLPFDACLGRARVIEVSSVSHIEAGDLERFDIQRDERLILKTDNTGRCWQADRFLRDFVYLAESGARYLASRGIALIGVDYLSVGGFYRDSVETHVALLKAGIWIVEGLDLRQVEPGEYDLICLPLRLAGADGSPARALLRQVKIL